MVSVARAGLSWCLGFMEGQLVCINRSRQDTTCRVGRLDSTAFGPLIIIENPCVNTNFCDVFRAIIKRVSMMI